MEHGGAGAGPRPGASELQRLRRCSDCDGLSPGANHHYEGSGGGGERSRPSCKARTLYELRLPVSRVRRRAQRMALTAPILRRSRCEGKDERPPNAPGVSSNVWPASGGAAAPSGAGSRPRAAPPRPPGRRARARGAQRRVNGAYSPGESRVRHDRGTSHGGTDCRCLASRKRFVVQMIRAVQPWLRVLVAPSQLRAEQARPHHQGRTPPVRAGPGCSVRQRLLRPS